ncbi:MAG: hypothetical protein ACM32E_21165 [Gemmatimonadota bacterium]
MSRCYLVHLPRAEARHLAGAGLAWPPGSPAADSPVRGPFAPDGRGAALPGRVEYLGSGIVRLDGAAIGSLAELPEGDDFRVVFEDVGPVLTVGPARYAAVAEEPDPKP